MFNIPNVMNSGIPPAPVGLGSANFGLTFGLFWTNTNAALPIQLGYDPLGGTAYLVYPPILGNGTVSIVFTKSDPPPPTTSTPGTSYAVRYISSGYVGPWSNNTIPY